LKRDIEERLKRGKSAAEVVNALREICGVDGEIEAITVSCGGFSPHRLVCMLRMQDEEQATCACARLGVIASGTADVIFSYELPRDFACRASLARSASSCLCFPVVDSQARIA
jgi:hypothetical protein